MAIDSKDARLTEMQPDWSIVDDLLGGTRAMRAQGKIYLPQYPAETEDQWRVRLGVSTLYNGFKRTVKTLAAKPFSQPLTYDDTNKEVAEWLENVDLEGQNLHNFAHSVFDTGIAKGMCHIWVDYPRVPQGATMYDVRSQNTRPYLIKICPEQVLGWKTERQNGYDVLTQVRFASRVCRPTQDPYIDAVVSRVNMLEKRPDMDNVLWSAYEYIGGVWILTDQSVITVQNIPFVTFYTRRKGFMLSEPPLMDVAYLNINHWQSQSDQNNILKYARVPVLFGAGFESDNAAIAIGAAAMIRNSNPNAKLEYVEHTGAAIDSGRQGLKDLEDQMRSMGAELLRPYEQKGDATATQINSEDDANACDLAAMAENLEDTLNLCLDFMGEFAGMGEKSMGMVTIYRDFAETKPDPADMDKILKMQTQGIVSDETVFDEAKRRGILSDDLDFEEEQQRIQDQPPPVGMPQIDPVTGLPVPAPAKSTIGGVLGA